MSLQINIVISGSGLIDTSKKVGFFGLSYSNLAADIQPVPQYQGPTYPDHVVGRMLLSVDPSVTMFRNTPQTFDQVLSLIGGFASLVMTVLGIAIGGYHAFNVETVMIANIYNIEDDRTVGPVPDKNWREVVEDSLGKRKQYEYSWFNSCGALFVCMCCENTFDCCKGCNKQKKRHEKTVLKLKKEMDLVNFIRNQRVARFNSEQSLRAYQAYFINKFHKYCIWDEDCEHVLENDHYNDKDFLDGDVTP